MYKRQAKFTKPVDSASYAKTVIANMKAKQQTQSKTYLAQAQAAAQNSGANAIGNPPPADVEPENAKGNALLDAIHKVNGVK